MIKVRKDKKISLNIVGFVAQVHDGLSFIEVIVNEKIVGYRFGEFCFTRRKQKRNGKKNTKK